MQQNPVVPHLTTALSGPLRELEQHILEQQVSIETFFRKAWQQSPAPLYTSVDLRNSGFKLAPVDTNLFAAGFNNLNPEFMPLCIQAMQSTLEQQFKGCERILIIPENHTRNMNYFESLATLQQICLKAGYDTRLASLLPDLSTPLTINLPSERNITLYPLYRSGNKVKVDGFDSCIIILNNDLAEGIPPLLENIEQSILPPLTLGWSHRLKSTHFHHYQSITEKFAHLIDIDPWLINPLFRKCEEINFVERIGEEQIVENVNELLKEIQKKYNEYEIKEQPFVIVKADAGTYGMAVMAVRSADEIIQLNRKERNNMAMSKGKKAVTKAIIQEGVYSFETVGDEHSVAEPVVYSIGHHVVGGFYRVHKQKQAYESLNAPGMHFEHLAFAECCTNPSYIGEPIPNRFYSYGVIARLAVLAAAQEIQDIDS